jgi:hypothetical protein
MDELQKRIQEAREQLPIYRNLISQVSEERLDSIEDGVAKQETGVESFAAEMMLNAERNRRDLLRWAVGTKIPRASEEKITAMFSEQYPQHVAINRDALGLIQMREVRRFPEVDEVCSDICTAVARRLPRTLDGYNYVDGYAYDELYVPNIGRMSVTLNNGHDVFKSIGTLESDVVRIWNCRPTGRVYMRHYLDISLPQKITIYPWNFEVQLYEDNSGIFFGKADGGLDEKQRITEETWNREKERIAGWLNKNVLKNILLMPEAKIQINEPPRAGPCPQELGDLYTWMTVQDASKLILTGYDPSKVYPHERSALNPNHRLIPYVTPGKYPEAVYRGFIYCALNPSDARTFCEKEIISLPGSLDEVHMMAKVRPKDAEEIFVVDYQAKDDFRDRYFAANPSKTWMDDMEYYKLMEQFANTLTPAPKYRGNFRKPVALIGRSLAFGEVEVIPQIQYDPRSNRFS